AFWRYGAFATFCWITLSSLVQLSDRCPSQVYGDGAVRGPFWHAPLPGQRIRADRPMEVAIMDERGNLSGANNWKGLHIELEKLLGDIQREGLYTRHECNLCCQRVETDGQEADVRGAVCDGLTAVRRAKCAVYGCPGDLCDTPGAR
ncbi:unnamed protein product, partial [Ectocarpus sp. 12 AP-2014]